MTKRLNNGAGVSRYLRLYRVLSQALAEGRIGVGEPLPSEPRLMREYRVSRSTVRRALARLEAEDRIVRKRGSGTYAQDLAPAAISAGSPPAAAGPAPLPPITAYRTLAFEHISTPGFLASDQPGFGDTALLIRRIWYAGREPVVLEVVHVPEAIGQRLTRGLLSGRRRRDGDRGAVLSILESLGHRAASLDREFTALPADPVTAKALELAVGEPILNVHTVARDSQHNVLACVDLFHHTGRYEARAAVALRARARSRPGRRR